MIYDPSTAARTFAHSSLYNPVQICKTGRTTEGTHRSDVPPSPCSVCGSLADITADLTVMSADAPAVLGDRLMTHILQSSHPSFCCRAFSPCGSYKKHHTQSYDGYKRRFLLRLLFVAVMCYFPGIMHGSCFLNKAYLF